MNHKPATAAINTIAAAQQKLSHTDPLQPHIKAVAKRGNEGVDAFKAQNKIQNNVYLRSRLMRFMAAGEAKLGAGGKIAASRAPCPNPEEVAPAHCLTDDR
jgi:hypothetical protein